MSERKVLNPADIKGQPVIKRKPNFSLTEKLLLVQLVKQHPILSMRGPGVPNGQKDIAWINVGDIFRSHVDGVQRENCELKKAFDNLTHRLRKKLETAGADLCDRPMSPLSEALLQVIRESDEDCTLIEDVSLDSNLEDRKPDLTDFPEPLSNPEYRSEPFNREQSRTEATVQEHRLESSMQEHRQDVSNTEHRQEVSIQEQRQQATIRELRQEGLIQEQRQQVPSGEHRLQSANLEHHIQQASTYESGLRDLSKRGTNIPEPFTLEYTRQPPAQRKQDALLDLQERCIRTQHEEEMKVIAVKRKAAELKYELARAKLEAYKRKCQGFLL